MTNDKITTESEDVNDKNWFSHNISIPFDDFNNKQWNVVIIYGNQNIAQNFRKCNDLFFNHFKNIVIYDGGHIFKNTYEAVVHFTSLILEESCFPIFVGCDISFVEQILKLVDLPLCQISNNTSSISDNFSHENTSFVGYQRHLSTYDDILLFENSSYNSLSLGKMRTYPSLTEAILRDVQCAFINFNILKWSECRYSNGNLPTGLTTEELCQVAKYLGGASEIKSLYIEAGHLLESSYEMGLIASEIVWYFLEGYNFRSLLHPKNSTDFAEFFIVSDDMEVDLIFLKSLSTGLWWVKIETDNSPHYMACTYEEDEAALNNDIPDRILKFIQKL